MTFLIGKTAEGAEFPNDVVERWSDYLAHLKSIKDQLPHSVRDFFVADWHYNKEDPRCLHDAWLESVQLEEVPAKTDDRARLISARMTLLGWAHDRRLIINYSGLRRYCLSLPGPLVNAPFSGGHGDLLYDEVEIGPSGRPVHHFEFSSGTVATFEFETMIWNWESYAAE